MERKPGFALPHDDCGGFPLRTLVEPAARLDSGASTEGDSDSSLAARTTTVRHLARFLSPRDFPAKFFFARGEKEEEEVSEAMVYSSVSRDDERRAQLLD